MNPSPIQIQPVSFRRISVEFDQSRVDGNGSIPDNVRLNLDGVVIGTRIGFAPQEHAEDDGAHYLLTLRVVIDNDPPEADADTHYSPYLVDIEAGTEVRALPGTEKLDNINIEDLVVVNGTSLLWSAIREQMATLTARMPAGLAQLPTVNFLDLKEQREQERATKQSSVPRKRSSKRKNTSADKN